MKLLGFIILCLINISLNNSSMIPGLSAEGAINDPPSTHGMLVVGTQAVYLSHLPMFHKPHDYQAIMEADLGEDMTKAYFDDQKNHPEQGIYTIVPEPFVLPAMIQNPKPFKAKLFRGHFERGGVQIASSTKVNIKKVIYFKKLMAQGPRLETLNYLLFGNGDDTFLAHIVSAKPDFDQVLAVSIKKNDTVKSGMVLEVESLDPLKPVDPSVSVKAKVADAAGEPTVLESMKEKYLEFDDLGM